MLDKDINVSYTPQLDQWSNWVCKCGRILVGKPRVCPVCGRAILWEVRKNG